MDVKSRLEAILDATVAKVRAEVRIDRLRASLYDEAIRRHREEGAAPTWNARGLGSVRLDKADLPHKPYVADAETFGSWVAEHRPDGARAVITLAGPQDLELAIEALNFAGLAGFRSKVEVDNDWATDLLAGADVVLKPTDDGTPDIVEAVQLIDEATGTVETLPGVSAVKGAPSLVVSLDPERKRDAIAEVALELDDAEAAAAEPITLDVHDAVITPAGLAAELGAAGNAAADAGDQAAYDDEVARLERELGVRAVAVSDDYAVVLNPHAYDPAEVPELSAEERLRVNRFHALAITEADLDRDQADLRRQAVEEEEPALEGTIVEAELVVRDRVDVPLPDVIPEPVADVDATADVAKVRTRLVALMTDPSLTGLRSLSERTADELRQLAIDADLGLPKAKVKRALLEERIRARLVELGLIEAQP